MLTLRAQAKINLTLEVLGKRANGYHEIRSVIQTIGLYDGLSFQLGQNIVFKSNQPGWAPEASLVSRAAGLLREVTGCGRGAIIEIDKRIPLMSGLGGDSSDAAAVLRGLSQLWGLALSQDKLLGLAYRLGSDVPFFLHGGTALVKGRGEVVIPLPSLSPAWVVLLLPPMRGAPGKTKRLYGKLQAGHYTGGQITDKLVNRLMGGGEVVPSMLFNVFDYVAWDSFAGIEEYRGHFLAAGAEVVHLAGSGPALLTIMKDKGRGEKIYDRLREHGLDSYLVGTTSTIDV